MAILALEDLPAAVQTAELVEAMIAGANAKALRAAPCLGATGADAPTVDQLADARLVLIGAVKRWTEAGSGALQAQVAGPFQQTVDTRQRTGFHLWPSEITELRGICSAGTSGRELFSIDTAPTCSNHAIVCALNFGAEYCSCGADLTAEQYPLYEV